MDNSDIKHYNIQVYGKICMCGYKLMRSNPLTMHHIIPLSWGGKTTIINGSNVTNLPHTGIHILYDDDKAKAKKIIEYLRYFKEHPEALIAREFAEWLDKECREMDCIPTMTRGKVLVYKRRNNYELHVGRNSNSISSEDVFE